MILGSAPAVEGSKGPPLHAMDPGVCVDDVAVLSAFARCWRGQVKRYT